MSGKSTISPVSDSLDRNYQKGQGSRGPATCPVCGETGAREWLRAPDRFHGRQNKYTLVRCPGCSLVWQNDPPKPSEMHLHYTDAYQTLIAASGKSSPERWRDRQAALTPHKRSGAILDLGCSSGAFLESLPRESWQLYGIEMDAENARSAESRTGAQVFVGDILDAPFAPESFDAITCFDVLEHVYEPRQVMTRVRHWLKPGGVFYVLVPNVDSAESRVFRSYWHGLEMPRHLSHFSPTSLKFLAEASGLREVSLETHRNSAVGTSLRYVWDDIFQAVGVHRTAVAYRGEAGIAWRAARKLIRITALQLLLAAAPFAGEGESIHAVFQKDSLDSSPAEVRNKFS